MTTAAELARGIVAGDRRALARAITLVESTRAQDELAAIELLRQLDPLAHRGLRVGVSGPPGVGKSSLLEKLGLGLVHLGQRPAVLAIDPSSRRRGGSILGDKTRMAELSREPAAFVRPSPSGGQGGGVARTTADVIALCEAAGFSPVLVETVGVGQAELSVTSLVDLVLLLLEPGAGDQLQGIKKGLLEWGDVVAVTKADGDRAELARRTSAEFADAFRVLHGHATPPAVLRVSALEGAGVNELWQAIDERFHQLEASGELALRRRERRKSELHERLAAELVRSFRRQPERALRLAAAEHDVADGRVLAGAAVHALLSDVWLGSAGGVGHGASGSSPPTAEPE